MDFTTSSLLWLVSLGVWLHADAHPGWEVKREEVHMLVIAQPEGHMEFVGTVVM